MSKSWVEYVYLLLIYYAIIEFLYLYCVWGEIQNSLGFSSWAFLGHNFSYKDGLFPGREEEQEKRRDTLDNVRTCLDGGALNPYSEVGPFVRHRTVFAVLPISMESPLRVRSFYKHPSIHISTSGPSYMRPLRRLVCLGMNSLLTCFISNTKGIGRRLVQLGGLPFLGPKRYTHTTLRDINHT